MPGCYEEYFDIHYDWRLAFRGTAHIEKSVYEAYRYGKGIPSDTEDGCKTTDWKALCTNHYRNDDALDNWTNIREVLYGLVDNGILVKVLRFKGAGSNYLNWMSKNRLIESDWEDLKFAKPNFFGIKSAQAIVVLLNYMHFPQGEPSEYHDLFRTGEKEWRFAFRGTAKVGQLVYQAYETGAEVKDYMEATCKTG
ncbi:hypothetical protein RRG08_047826 [Elysia crispata]|uniref:Uncharacterized protein n=1 Tax=Elysia crispata TaxID=231223 RepID=A0AAE1AZ29_9GAST|nr:hypothetical protein RRG08_047826 [Elysia crispata]